MLETINSGLKSFVYEVQQITIFSFRMVLSVFGRPIYVTETLEQLYVVGIGSLWLISLTGIFAGQALALQFTKELAEFGTKNYLGRMMALSIIRELGPTLTGLMVAARVAAGITAEIGAMKSSNQLDALIAFGVNPIKKLAAPRLISLLVMVPVLTILCDVIAILGGWIIALFIAHITSTTYISAVNERLTFGNLFIGIVKPIVFALVIAFISCYKGFSTQGGTKGVGKSTTESVVISSITILIANFVLTKAIFSWLKGYF
jgi:phospholipid/cholesterol/gamma-HCH transport system permease protein